MTTVTGAPIAPPPEKAVNAGRVRALPFIDPADMPDLYAVRGVGVCMEPLFADGTLLVGDKREEPAVGDAVILHFRREHAARYGVPGWIKRLAMAVPPEGFDGLIIVEQLNPPRQFAIPSNHVAAVHKCVGTAEHDSPGLARFNPGEARRA
jgi:hypothetical protein